MSLALLALLFQFLIKLISTDMIIRENVIFEKVNEISTTRSQWLVAIQLDFNPYGDLLDHLESEINLAQREIFRAETDPNTGKLRAVSRETLELLRVMAMEFRNFKTAQEYLTSEFLDIRAMGLRTLRSLLPIIGKGLSALFGVLTEADIESVRVNVRRIAKDQQSLRHVVNESLTILKRVQGQVRDNRRTINAIIDEVTNITIRLDLFGINLEKLKQYVRLYAMLDRANAEVREMLNIARDHLQVTRLQLSMLSLGHLSSTVIAPSELQSLLIGIKGQLSPQFTLPFDPMKDIWTFYKTITCTTLIDADHVIVVIAIPLLDNTGMYEVYKVHNIPVPYLRSNTTHMRAKYRLESDHIAVDLKRTKFAALSELEAKDCSNTLRPYCTFRSPAYSVMATKMCIMHLFNGAKDKIKQHCQEMVVLNAPSPQAEYLRDGHWLITSDEPLTLSILCNTTQSTVVTKTPIDIIALHETCSAHDAHFSLLPYYHKESTYNMTETFTTFLRKYSADVVKVWAAFEDTIPDMKLIIPPKLKDIDEVPLDKLIADLTDYNLSLEPMGIDLDRYWLYGLLTFLLVVLLLAFCCRKRLQKLLRKYNVNSKFRWSKGERKREVSEQSTPEQAEPLRPATEPSAPRHEPNVHLDGERVHFTTERPVWRNQRFRQANTRRGDRARSENYDPENYGPDVNLAGAYMREKYPEHSKSVASLYPSVADIVKKQQAAVLTAVNHDVTMETGESVSPPRDNI
jgi:hypothetical protein